MSLHFTFFLLCSLLRLLLILLIFILAYLNIIIRLLIIIIIRRRLLSWSYYHSLPIADIALLSLLLLPSKIWHLKTMMCDPKEEHQCFSLGLIFRLSASMFFWVHRSSA